MRILIPAFAALIAGPVSAQNIDYLVAPRGTAAYDAAKAREDGQAVFAERSLTAALRNAHETLSGCGACRVTIRIASGEYDGKAGTGQWSLPEVIAPDASLHILGGYDETFETRNPFLTPTLMVTPPERSGIVLSFEGKKHALSELVVSGLTFDVSPSNAYDAQTNTLMFSGSSTWGILRFGYLTTNHLVVADNVFLNAPNGVAAPAIRAMSDQALVEVTNNVFMNNVYTWQVTSGGGKFTPRYRLAGNSFVLNWPRNPDRATSNPGTLEIGNKYSASQIDITRNLFAFNVGGAIFPQWDDVDGPNIAITENLFWDNGAMFDPEEPADGAVVGKFNGSATHAIFDPYDLEDDFAWDTYDNVDIDPELAVPVLEVGVLKDIGRGVAPKLPEEDLTLDSIDFSLGDEGEGDDDLSLDLPSLDTGLSELTLDADFGMDELAGDDGVLNFAPLVPYDPRALPFPHNPEAAEYGASYTRIYQQGEG